MADDTRAPQPALPPPEDDVAALEDHRPDPRWWGRSACEGADPGLFFPGPAANTTAVKERFCGRCPVRIDCLYDAVATPRRTYGIRGGRSERERRRIRRALHLAPAGT